MESDMATTGNFANSSICQAYEGGDTESASAANMTPIGLAESQLQGEQGSKMNFVKGTKIPEEMDDSVLDDS